jgi:hypothetical protein
MTLTGQVPLSCSIINKKLNINSMKKTSVLKASALGLGLALGAQASAQIIEPGQDPQIESHVKTFLNVLNSGNGKPIEQLPAADARAVLAGAQSSVKVDLSGITVTEKIIHHESYVLISVYRRPSLCQ